MKLSKIVSSIALIGAAAAFAAPAYAGYIVLDGWEMDIGPDVVSPIGRLNLVSGTATVEQQLVGGVVTIGSQFVESGSIFSLSYTAENTIGAGDSGAPVSISPTMTISFSDVTGHVTEFLGGGGFHYVFDSGIFTISSGAFTASGSIIGIGGNTLATTIIGGVTGDSTLLANVLTSSGIVFKDNLGTSLMGDLASGEVLFEATTNNNVTSGVGNAPAPTFGACSFDALSTCQTFSVASAGDAYLVRKIPEPASLALVGLGLLGAGAARRRKTKAV